MTKRYSNYARRSSKGRLAHSYKALRNTEQQTQCFYQNARPILIEKWR